MKWNTPKPDLRVDFAEQSEKPDHEAVTATSNDAAMRQPSIVRRNSSMALPNLIGATIQHEMIVEYLYQQQRSRFWISNFNSMEEGAFMRESWSSYVTAPVLLSESILAQALVDLNAEIVITMKSKIVEAVFRLNRNLDRMSLRSGLQIQLLPSLRDVKLAQKHQCAAFIQEEAYVLVWDDNPTKLLQRATELERQLVDMAWFSATESEQKTLFSQDRETSLLLGAGLVDERHPTYINSVICGCTLTLSLFVVGLGMKVLARESALDHTYSRLAAIIFTPIQFLLALFFMQVVIVCAFQLIGPVGQVHTNSKYYSAKAPPRVKTVDTLPHVTIQCPIYTENLEKVVEPTIMSLKAAISTYEMQGGSANIFVNDDGMLAGLSKDEINKRQKFYKKNNIGWVARPAHNPIALTGKPKFLRRGRFKKASNMNFALMLSIRLEEKLADVVRDENWSQQDEDREYERCLRQVITEIGSKPKASGNIRVGDYILLVDSDTRIPEDCLLDAVNEMELSPEVGILQYTSGVLHVSKDFFESGISYFTDLIYTAIGYMVSNGDVGPFVGHNAFLRWQSMQDVAYFDEEDEVIKFWSECSVSEDFDMSLRLQRENWIIRFATYTGEGFKEGVSLTIYDEITRWEKYAYGCSELVFHPLKNWPRKGPFTPLVRRFITSNTPIAAKLSTIGYIASYYAIGSAWIFSLANYFLIGWAESMIDKWYLPSFNVFIGLLFIFSFVCNISLALLRYRTNARTNLIESLFENFKWVFLFTILFGGLSLSVSRALLCHLLSIDISWSMTKKEVESSNFFREVPKILKSFVGRFSYCVACLVLILVCAFGVPHQWRIRQFSAIFPLALSAATHFLLPIALNPALMRLTW
ncbi:hypothetical protein VTL71DRAFT_12128 [Oculimacula yallundae]|uniref:Glycosyltransferase 2-like domain-containing protein n=1 Tax=Oculimacula yallundae TaxID=86028 RepID=A0ABR4CS56_9HELO